MIVFLQRAIASWLISNYNGSGNLDFGYLCGAWMEDYTDVAVLGPE